jgi:histidinol-phosphate phosphatase family protein
VSAPTFDVVIPAAGRPSLARVLEALAAGQGPLPGHVFVVDDRREPVEPLLPDASLNGLASGVRILPGRGAGPASARNIGWRASGAQWVVFLDDDVIPAPTWLERLAEDLADRAPDVGGIQGRVRVPLPVDRRPTDWERNVNGLERARWATADMAYRRSALARVGGFDERFSRAFREDADLALRIARAGYRIVSGSRCVVHPVGRPGRWTPLSLQRGNADDVLMRALHGRSWHEAAGAPRGRRRRHLAVTASLAIAVASAFRGRRGLALAGSAGWLAGTVELVWARLRPGPGTRDEAVRVIGTSVLLPLAATFWWVAGWVRLPFVLSDRRRAPKPRRPDAVLLDRDGTLVLDVPYNGDPARIVPVEGAREALDRLRAAGIATAVVSNQSGIARGFLTLEQVEAVNRRISEILGPLGPWFICPHGPDAACPCRKPGPGLVLQAAEALGVSPERCALVGDIGADIAAAAAAGARGVLVPSPATRPEEIASAPEVAPTLAAAVDLLLEGSG